ncbi:MAG: phospho-sugar mutase [Clostridiales bacterium]|nr:phospho-sugar mutase [Clostridiales bacterium]
MTADHDTQDLKIKGSRNRQAWLDSPCIDEKTKQNILQMTDENAIAEAFGQELAFGTGGMRGVMGPGSNRMNPYTVRKVILGVAQWLKNKGSEALARGAAIAYDTRHHSEDFARHTAVTLAEKGVRVYLFDRPTPTPVLSFAIRYLGCETGVILTASHNTKEYNGMKIYNDGGCQLPPAEAAPLLDEVEAIPLFSPQPEENFDSLVAEGRIKLLGEEFRHLYTDTVLGHSLLDDAAAKEKLSVVYTPLNGAGNLYVREALAKSGFPQVATVPEQEAPDGDFPTVIQPNPEDTQALALAIDLAEKRKAHLVVGTDPDSDRMGTAVSHQGVFRNITGNQIGVLLADYILSRKKELGLLPAKGVLINTIVSSTLGEVIARAYGLDVIKTLTGFKYIGEQMILLRNAEGAGDKGEFVFGYEESNGYLIGDFSRDKDAIGAALLFCEAAAWWLQKGLTMVGRLEEIYRIYGYFLDHLDNFVFPGIEGMAKMERLMGLFRRTGASALPQVREVEDYLLGINGIPSDNVLRFMLEDNSWIAARPSGTEPKLKIYYSVCAEDKEKAGLRLEELREAVRRLVEEDA